MRLDNLQALFVLELKDLHSAERQLVDALPLMADAASHPELRNAFHEHLETTREQVGRLDRIFDMLGESPTDHKCKGMQGIIDEGKDLLDADIEPDVLDAGLIGAAQRAEHYEISGYGTVRTYAESLGFMDAARMLQQTLDEEGETDHRLTDLAERIVNPAAIQQGGA